MTKIQLLTAEQEALIPEYREKWQRITLSTQPLDRVRAKAVIQGAYAVMGEPEPEVIVCPSPRAALELLRQHLSPVEILNASLFPEAIPNQTLQVFAKSAWQTFNLLNQQQQAQTNALHDLMKAVSNQADRALENQIELQVPSDVTPEDFVEQVVLGFPSISEAAVQQLEFQGELESSRTLEETSVESWLETGNETASWVEEKLAWLPGKGLLRRGSLKWILKLALTFEVLGIEYYRFPEIVARSLSIPDQQLSASNYPIIISHLSGNCIWLDFAFSILNYPKPQKEWLALQGLAKYCGSIYGAKNLCIVCDRPTKIRLDEDNRLHGEGEPAIEFADGFVAYAYHNTPLPEKYGTVAPSQWQSQWVLEERNKEVQKVLARVIGAVRLCQELPTVELDRMEEYILLKLVQLDNVGVKDIHILKRIDSAIGNCQAVFVPIYITSVRLALPYIERNFTREDFPTSEG